MTILPPEQKLLKKAAIEGDVAILKRVYREDFNKIVVQQRHLMVFPDEEDDYYYNCGNIFHLAVYREQDDFIKKAIAFLPPQDTQTLLLQPRNESNKWNPLHLAAFEGNFEIVKMFLEVYSESIPRDPSKRPWLQEDEDGKTPCFVAVDSGEEECAMEILKMDIEVVCTMTAHDGSGLLYNAVANGFDELTTKILKSSSSFTTEGYKGNTPLHCITSCTGTLNTAFRIYCITLPCFIYLLRFYMHAKCV